MVDGGGGMILTEEEAREKWCPSSGTQQLCIGPQCMHWRWWDNEYRDERRTIFVKNRRGYCGLSGKPEVE